MEALILSWFLKVGGVQGIAIVTIFVILHYKIKTIGKDIQNMSDDITEIKTAIPQCQLERKKEESRLHDRITDTAKEVSHLKGRVNGHQEAESHG